MAEKPGEKLGRELEAMATAIPLTLSKVVLQAAHYGAGVVNASSRDIVGVRTGALSRSYVAELVSKARGEVTAEVFSTLIYAGIHDRGGEIRPKTRKYLAIPLFRNPIGKWPRHFGGGELRFVVGRKGPMLVAAKSGKPMFLLRRSVFIKPTNYIGQAWLAAQPGIYRILESAAEGVTR